MARPRHTSRVALVPDVAERAKAYAVPARIVDGMDVVAVREAARDAVAATRAGAGPTLLECKTYRFTGHSRSDARGYRTREEEARSGGARSAARPRRESGRGRAGTS